METATFASAEAAGQGDLVQFRVGRAKAYVVSHPELAHQVLVNDRVFEKGGLFVDRLREFIGDSVTTCPRPEHRRLRRLMQPAFHPGRFPGYARTITTETEAVISLWQDGQVLDAYTAMYPITARIAARTMFAAPASRALVEDAQMVLTEIISSAGRRMFMPPADRIPTPGKVRYDRARRRIREITDQLTADYRTAGVDHGDLMSMLLAARDENAEPLSEQEISDQVVTLFLGGIETVASTLGWALSALARKCIADAFSMIEAPLILAAIASRWRIEAVGTPIRPLTRISLILNPRGQRIRIIRRDRPG
ncbi:cytochrome P450 [Actinocrispum sp. NPDC049592]|uniref:cytochrome P450 n=1 Tax=Actinocrispum sp. NPDC049592 TaxID=3154835 RepID=UPI00342640ED